MFLCFSICKLMFLTSMLGSFRASKKNQLHEDLESDTHLGPNTMSKCLVNWDKPMDEYCLLEGFVAKVLQK